MMASLKKHILGLCFILSLFAMPARADRSQHELWLNLMEGSIIPEKISDLENWIHPSESCKKNVHQTIEDLKAYGKSSYQSHSREVYLYYHSLFERMNRLHDQKDKTCFQEVSKTYLLGSLWISDRWAQTEKSGIVTGIGCERFACGGPPENIYLLLLTNALLKAKKIQFDVPPQCDFTYNCALEVIHLNPITKPKEDGGKYGGSPEAFAGHYLHELDHLFRYKFVDVNYVSEHFGSLSDPKKIDWKRFLLLDEVLAKLISASTQVANQFQSAQDKIDPNQLGDDFNLYVKGGPFEALLRDHFLHGNGDREFVQLGYMDFLRSTFLTQDSPEEKSTNLINLDLKWMHEILNTLNQGYFPGSTEEEKDFDPKNQSIQFDPLAYRLAAWTPGTVDQREIRLTPSEIIYFRNGRNGISDRVIPLKMFLEQIETVIKPLDTISSSQLGGSVCSRLNDRLSQAYHDRTHVDSLSSYYGLTCQSLPENGVRTDDPNHPENGVRTESPAVF